ncbi:uncharacterized protein ELE39_002420 [Cryptosporidium sp. chipmunk genotype I]|uniref:uncharacterized protein n=1 Tax=Cryptosporidium sp. chipmunk genotype I TaxID=1280935 RepID=UPI00351A2136|nr:hypothetical protein ELE39_002420 [Cryptosporidium sp. chipmunk genotype I]
MSLQTCLGTLIIILENLSGVIGLMNGVVWNFLTLDSSKTLLIFQTFPIHYLLEILWSSRKIHCNLEQIVELNGANILLKN